MTMLQRRWQRLASAAERELLERGDAAAAAAAAARFQSAVAAVEHWTRSILKAGLRVA